MNVYSEDMKADMQKAREKVIRERNLAELNRQLARNQSELATLEHLSEWGNQSYRFGIQHHRQQIEKLTAAIERASQG